MTLVEAVIEDPSALVEEKDLVRFERAEEYLSLLSSLLSSTSSASAFSSARAALVTPSIPADDVLTKLVAILDEYQDHPHLLDPYLERIVSPPVESLQRHVRYATNSYHGSTANLLTPEAVARLSKLVYAYTKVRGYKTIVHYFPHEVADLPATLSFLEQLQQSLGADAKDSFASCWELRYLCLLWLSLICMIPFDLAKFDRVSHGAKKTTASRIAAVAEYFITSPGKERDAAAVVLGRLFQRDDVQLKDDFDSFLASSLEELRGKELSPFHATGILQALCEVLKTSEPEFVRKNFIWIRNILDEYDTAHNSSLRNNGLIIKYQTKLNGRVALKLLRPRNRKRANKFHVLGASSSNIPSSDQHGNDDDDEDESEIPEEVETLISCLMEALQHNDTVVRYSAAKGLARICDRLPTSFLNQVVEAIISLFHINVPDVYTGASDLNSVSEHSWQGACMALAELSRRGLLFAEMLSEALPWILKALLFDVRRGAHSVGANVRDAACYVVWALARSNDTDSIRPHALDLAKRLVAVATLDRDVSIRRAASAAFQESVGRLALFPHGIEVIRMTDFYAVSVRRNAFLECALKVAAFEEYRGYLVDHLIDVVTVHWHVAMRRLGAQAVARIAMHDPTVLLPDMAVRLSKRIETSDNTVLHGTLLTLAEVCRACRMLLDKNEAGVFEKVRERCFGLLDSVRPSILRSLGAAPILQAACQLIGAGAASSTISTPSESQTWEKVLNLALARQEESVHIAAAEAVSEVSIYVELSSKIQSTLDSWSSLTVPQQQSNALLLGAVDYQLHSAMFERVINHLLLLCRPSAPDLPKTLYSPNIEVRRNACDSLTRAITHLGTQLSAICSADLLEKAVRSLLLGLQDYSTDQRGDVGSWVRLSCIAGLRQILILCRQTGQMLPEKELQQVVAGMWKQAAERIDHVRHAAGTSVLAVYHAYEASEVRPIGYDVVEDAFGAGCFTPLEEDRVGSMAEADAEKVGMVAHTFKDARQAFPRLCKLLVIARYRISILEGIIISVGSKSDLGERVIGPALTALTAATYPIASLLGDLFTLAKAYFGNNRMFVPAISTVNLLLENGASQADIHEILARLVKMCITNAAKIKSIARLTVSATLCANIALVMRVVPDSHRAALLGLLQTSTELFLAHSFPTVRTCMAEHLYAVLSSSVEFDQHEPAMADSKSHIWLQLEHALLDTKWSAPASVDATTISNISLALRRMLS